MIYLPVILICGLLKLCLGLNYDYQFNSYFELDGKSNLTLMNNSNDTLNIQLENWYSIPLEAQKIDTFIPPASFINLDIVTQGNSYYDLYLNEVKYQIFTSPNSADSIYWDFGSKKVTVNFLGDLKEINTFLLKKSENFKSSDAEWMPRTIASQSDMEFKKLIFIYDSITNIQKKFLIDNGSTLPDWYLSFESDRQDYLNAGFKLRSNSYRKRMLKFEDDIPENFLQKTISTIIINNEKMIGCNRYAQFLNAYISFKTTQILGADL